MVISLHERSFLNYLAHFYLVRDNEDLIVGNLLADFIRGNKYRNFSAPIQKGILLHRKIDVFTDSHPEVEKTKIRLRNKYRKFAPVISDVFYDYVLGKHWSDYAEVPLQDFSSHIYSVLFNNIHHLPEDARLMLSWMSKNDWLYHYSTFFGIQKALEGLSRRTKYDSGMEEAIVDLRKDLTLIEKEFKSFFASLISFVENEKLTP